MSLVAKVRYGIPWRLDLRAAQRRAKRRHPGLNVRVARGDDMLQRHQEDAYFEVGASALDNMRAALTAAGTGVPSRILDLPCGYGRVTRFERLAWPQAAIVGAEINRDAVGFCAATFSVEGVYSSNPISNVDVGVGFDLIFCGSLLTHFDAHRWGEVLAYFRDRLSERGVAVVTTHGERSADLLRRDPVARAALLVSDDYGLAPDVAARVLAAYNADGFGYGEYPGAGSEGYGVSVSSPAWVRAQLAAAGVREVLHVPHGWGEHQDVWAFTRQA